MRLSSEFARLRESFTIKMHSRLPNATVQMLLYLYVNLRLMNKLTSEMGNFFTDFNSHEFEEMVDPISCTPHEEPKENIVEIDETFSEKESSVTTVFSWSNFQYRIVVLLQLLAPNDTRLIPRWLSLTLPQSLPAKRTRPPSLVVCEDVHTYI